MDFLGSGKAINEHLIRRELRGCTIQSTTRGEREALNEAKTKRRLALKNGLKLPKHSKDVCRHQPTLKLGKSRGKNTIF